MSYRCRLDATVAKMIGEEAGGPRIKCDLCGFKLDVKIKHGGPPKWLLDNKAAPKWRLVRVPDGRRKDYCPECKDSPAAT
jgi:hypothetical protein